MANFIYTNDIAVFVEAVRLDEEIFYICQSKYNYKNYTLYFQTSRIRDLRCDPDIFWKQERRRLTNLLN